MATNLPIAGINKRIKALLIDLAVILVCGVIAAILFGERQTYYSDTTVRNSAGQVVNSGEGVTHTANLTGIPFAVFCVLAFAYFVVMEKIAGMTIGKRLAKIKVVNGKGKSISWGQSLIRNSLRVVDGLPYVIPYLFGLLWMLSTKKRQRLGDNVAKTFVVLTSS